MVWVEPVMRSFTTILVLVAVALLAGALCAYPAWVAVNLISDQPIHRVLHRIAMLVALLSALWLFRRWDLFSRHALGFGQPRRIFGRYLLGGLIAGAAVILPLTIALHALGVRAPKTGMDLSFLPVMQLLLYGLASGLVIALIEECFFRGLLFTAVRRESGTILAVILPSLLYAAVHFLGGRLRLPADQIDWSSGFAVLENMLIQYSRPGLIIDSFVALFAVGALLAWVRARTRSIAACIGLHAAWVCVIAYVRETTSVQTHLSNAWLVGNYDGVLGWGALIWMALLLAGYLAALSVRASQTDKDSDSSKQRA